MIKLGKALKGTIELRRVLGCNSCEAFYDRPIPATALPEGPVI